MKNLMVLLLTLTSLNVYAGFISPFQSTVKGISIPNAHDISRDGSGKIIRGQRPYVDGGDRLPKYLKVEKLGSDSRQYMNEIFGLAETKPFTDILIFKEDNSGEVANQKIVTDMYISNSGHWMNVYEIPFKWRGFNDYRKACLQTIEALQIMREVMESPSRRLYFHCTVGEDRTGYLAALWRILDQKWLVNGSLVYNAFQDEMCVHGYGHGNPRKPKKVYGAIQNDLTPLYIEMARLINEGLVTYDGIQPENFNLRVCDRFVNFDPGSVDISDFKCEPQAIQKN